MRGLDKLEKERSFRFVAGDLSLKVLSGFQEIDEIHHALPQDARLHDDRLIDTEMSEKQMRRGVGVIFLEPEIEYLGVIKRKIDLEQEVQLKLYVDDLVEAA